MIKRRYMRTRQLKPGMIIDQVIKDPTGRNLVVQGSAIDDYIISSLLKLGIMSVYIREGNADPDDPDAILSPKAAAMVKQLRTDDRSKVTLSDSVRQRVSTGVQYIFNNTNSGNKPDCRLAHGGHQRKRCHSCRYQFSQNKR